MTWHYQIADDGSEMDVWDHTQDPATDAPLVTVQNDGSGITVPDDVEEEMFDAAEAARDAGKIDRWRAIHLRLAAGKIDEVTP